MRTNLFLGIALALALSLPATSASSVSSGVPNPLQFGSTGQYTTLLWAQKKALTKGASTSYLKVTLAAGDTCHLLVTCNVKCTDGTDVQSGRAVITIACNDKAGIASGGGGFVSNGSQPSAGTFTWTSHTVTPVGNDLTFLLNVTSSLTPTTLDLIYDVQCESSALVTLTPQ